MKYGAGDQNLSKEDILDTIAARFSILEVRDFFQQETNITFYWNTVFTLIAWMHFLYRNIGLCRSLSSLSPDAVAVECDDKSVFFAAIQVVFPQDDCERLFYRAWGQVFGT